MYVVDSLHFLMEPGELCDYFRQASQSIKEYKDVNNLQFNYKNLFQNHFLFV